MIAKPELFLPGLVATKGCPTWQWALFHSVSAVAPTGPSVLEGASQPGEGLVWALCSLQSNMIWTTYQQQFLVSQVWRLALETSGSGGAVLPQKALGERLF